VSQEDELFGAPAGWYPDPLGLPQLRWWNNHSWTEQISAARQPLVVQDTKFAWADEELPTRRDERERERGAAARTPADTAAATADSLRQLDPPRAFHQVNSGAPAAPAAAPSFQAPPAAAPSAPPAFQAAAPAAPPAAPTAAPAAPPVAPASSRIDSLYQPDPVTSPVASTPSVDSLFGTRPAAGAPAEALDALFGAKESQKASTRVKTPILTADQVGTATRVHSSLPSNTGPAWIIAMIPLFQLVVSMLVLNALGMGGSALIYFAILVVPYLVVIGLAYLDNGMLLKAGISAPAHWGWAALTAPVYLLMRARAVIRETGHGIGPVLVWFGLGALHVASVLVIPGIVVALLPAVFSAQIEESVAADAMLISGTSMTVSCPDTPPVLIGEQVVCSSVSASGNEFDITVTQERRNGWISWQVIDWGSFNI
jgi:hypothetical protein